MATDRWTRQFRAAVALFLVVLGARLMLVGHAGSHLPLWDQWFGEFAPIVAVDAQRPVRVSDLAIPHNEHFVLFPRLMTLGLLKVGGRWEPKDELVVSALVRAAGLAAVFLLLGRGRSASEGAVLLVLLAGLGALPVGVFNLLSGFQVQFFLGEPLAVVALFLLCSAPLTLDRLSLGGLALLIGLFNMATPLLAAATAALLLGLRALRGESPRTNLMAASFLGSVALWAYWSSRSRALSSLAAHDVAQFVGALTRLWAWPFPEAPVLALLVPVPLLLLLRRMWRADPQDRAFWFILSLTILGLLQDVATASARALGGGQLAQYTDGIWFRLIVGFLGLAQALSPSSPAATRAQVPRGAAVWACFVAAAMLADSFLRGVPEMSAIRSAAETRLPLMARALESGDFQTFEAENQVILEGLSRVDLRFFTDSTLRFAIPSRFITDLRRLREPLLRRMPAALVGSAPGGISVVLQGLVGFGSVILLVGLVAMATALRRSKDDLPGRLPSLLPH